MRWTDDEDSFLKENYKLKGTKYCSEYLNRTTNGIKERARKVKIAKPKTYLIDWSKEEIDFIIKNFPEKGGKFCGDFLGKAAYNVNSKAKKLGLKFDAALWQEDLSDLTSIVTPVKAYWHGILYADGNLRKDADQVRFTLVKEDMDDIKDLLLSAIGNTWLYREIQPKDLTPQGNLRKLVSNLNITNKKYYEFLKEHDYHIKSGASACKILSKIPEHLKHYWFRGYFDGDGGFFNKGCTYRFSFASCYNQDWSFAKSLLNQLNVKYRERQEIRPNGNGKSSITCDGFNGVEIFGNYIYQGEQFGLKRKYDKFIQLLENKKQNKLPRGTNRIKKGSSTGFKGAYFLKNSKLPYVAQISFKSKCVYIGKFLTAEEAARAYDNKAIELFGNRAILNFPFERDSL